MNALIDIRAFVESACAEVGYGREDCHRLLLIVEELFMNTITHGYRGESDSPVWITLEPCASGLALSYEDAAPPHDPFASHRPMDEGVLVAEQTVGGHGVQLIRTLAATVSYRREQDRNCIKLTFAASTRR